MKKTAILAAMLLPLCAWAQENDERLDSVVVSSTRAGEKTPVTYSVMGAKALQAASPSASLPMAMNLLPSVVTYNEGGTGLGNSAMTIRGVKGSQINVTLNGITLNDAESQEVFWVNIPALTGLLSGVQVQRGLGTSLSGAGAFGASINMDTGFVGEAPSARVEFSAGSYKTMVTSAAVSTGLLPHGFYAQLAWNLAHTDGYIRNARVLSSSLFGVLGWMNERHSVRLTYLMGEQTSGITWDGISPEMFALHRTYNGAGEYVDDEGVIRYYPNQEDVYAQHHLQLNYTVKLSPGFSWSNTLDYTRGDGYDEYYKTGREFAEFGYPFAAWEGAEKSDMTFRKRLSNNLYVWKSDLRYRGRRLKVDGGLALSYHQGRHWGEMMWARLLPKDFDYSQVDWYANYGNKLDMSAFARAEYQPLPWLTAYADLQYRHIHYDFWGADEKASKKPIDYHQNWDFFNPRAGVTGVWGGHKAYASVALGHREPGRSDIKENVKGELIPIKPEAMVDVEAGYAFTGAHFQASVSLYAMEYFDMLLETGKLSSSGYAIKENVGRGWRRGVELSAAYAPWRWLSLDGNATFSTNRLASFTAYLKDWGAGRYVEEVYNNTPMLMSPSVVAAGRVKIQPWSAGPSLSLSGKYVGKQYWDNTGCADRCIPAYFVMDGVLAYSVPFRIGTVSLSLHVNNLLNHNYYANVWVYREWSGKPSVEAGVYPQALRNFMVKCSLSF